MRNCEIHRADPAMYADCDHFVPRGSRYVVVDDPSPVYYCARCSVRWLSTVLQDEIGTAVVEAMGMGRS